MLRPVIHLTDSWTRAEAGYSVRTHPGQPFPSGDRVSVESWRDPVSAVLTDETKVTLTVDHLRSWPLFFAMREDQVHISDSIELLRRQIGPVEISDANRVEFLHGGYVAGAETLFTGVSQVPCGTTVEIDLGTGAVESTLYRRMQIGHGKVDDPAEFTHRFEDAAVASLVRTTERARGRRLVIPLSAGLDSRLLATLLVRLGYPRVLAFTYGLPTNTEARISQEVARRLGIEWHFVPYEPEWVRREWNSPSSREFLAEGWSGSALPHIQDYLALRELRRLGIVDAADIIVPGHTIVDDGHDAGFRGRPIVGRDELITALVRSHYSLQGSAVPASTRSRVREKMVASFKECGFDGSPASVMEASSWWVQRERQAKYINNSVRVYECLDLEWDLPLHSRDTWDAYEQGSYRQLLSRWWYQEWINRVFREVTGTDDMSVTKVSPPDPRRERVTAARRIADAAGISEAHRRLMRTQVQMVHPMAFEAFVSGVPHTKLAASLLRGRTLMGYYTEQFLEDRWVAGTSLFSNAPAT